MSGRREYDPDGLKNLAAGIVIQAAEDWRYICATAKNLEDDNKKHRLQFEKKYASFNQLRQYFLSEDCGNLCLETDPEIILSQLEKEREEAIRRNKPIAQRGKEPVYICDFDGKKRTLKEIAQITNINYTTLLYRIVERKMTIEQAVNWTKWKKKPH